MNKQQTQHTWPEQQIRQGGGPQDPQVYNHDLLMSPPTFVWR